MSVDNPVSAVLEAVRREDRKEALSRAVAALGAGATHPLVLMLAAEALEPSEGSHRAIGLLAQALAASDEPELWRRYGGALARGGRLAEALEAFEEALDIDPADAAALEQAGAAAFQSGAFAAAGDYYERRLALGRDEAATLAALAAVRVRQGRPSDAAELAQRALDLEPRQSVATLALARAELGCGRAESAAALASKLIDAPATPTAQRVAALDVRAEALDALDEPATAFADYAARNALNERLAAAAVAALPERRSDQTRRLRREFDPTVWQAMPAPALPGSPAAGHVFLLGFPRSGTTLLEKALASHPEATSLEEVDALGDAAGDYLARPGGLELLRTEPEPVLAALRESYWTGVAKAADPLEGKVLVDKLPLHTLALPVIARLFPQARVLFALRDPRDVVFSCFRRRFEVNSAMYEFLDLARAAAFYDEVMTLAEAYRAALPLPVKDVRHEAVVADFDGEVAGVLRFIGLPWTEAVRGFDARARARPRTPSDLQLVGGLTDAGLGQWRRYARELSPVLPVLDRWVRRWGYQP